MRKNNGLERNFWGAFLEFVYIRRLFSLRHFYVVENNGVIIKKNNKNMNLTMLFRVL